jgi:Type ISP C-terminal specificity domain/N-6 DNA Methylase
LNEFVLAYAANTSALSTSTTTIEGTYYPDVVDLISKILRERKLPFQVRATTSERRSSGGRDQPDVAMYDGNGNFIVVCCEVKTPDAKLKDLAVSTDRNDQIGRYLAQTGVVVLCNVWSFGLLTALPSASRTEPVPPHQRRLEQIVEMWPSASALRRGLQILPASASALGDLLELAVTRYAPIAEPQSLARILARQARKAKQGLPAKFTESVQSLLEDFGSALGIAFDGPDGEEFFRSSLIQTIYYGVFAGWLLWQRDQIPNSGEKFEWERVPEYLKIPFLGELFYELKHPVRIRELGLRVHLEIATETLSRVNQSSFIERLKIPDLLNDDDEYSSSYAAIMYFYEPFLEAFDPFLRKELGVWYTPPEIVRYQVQKVDQLLRSQLSCPRGLADESVVVLDPCCGTGAYLVEVLRVISRQLRSEGVGSLMGEHLLKAVVTRIVGFEILTAPFVIAHLQIYLMLARMGVEPEPHSRAAIFLTNALTGWNGPDQLKLHFPELQIEHDAARSMKANARIVVVIGNPPYNRFAGVPVKEETSLADFYKGIHRDERGRQEGTTDLYAIWGIRKHLLDDLYIRFFRLAEECIGERAEYGIVSFISNNSYLNGRSHPIMRESLMQNFDTIWIDNLHGNRLASERTPEGDSCETIFNVAGVGAGIKVGTAISTLLKKRRSHGSIASANVLIRDFWGKANEKRKALLASMTESSNVLVETDTSFEGTSNYERLSPTSEGGWKFVRRGSVGGYESWIGIDEIFPANTQGVNPNRGLSGSVIDSDADKLRERMKLYFSDLPFEDLKQKSPDLCESRARYNAEEVRTRLVRRGYDPAKVVQYLLFPLDQRWIYYETFGKLLNESRPELFSWLGDNEFLIAVPQPRRYSETRLLISKGAFDLHVHDRGAVGFPAQINDSRNLFTASEVSSQRRVANLLDGLLGSLSTVWGIEPIDPLVFAGQLLRYCLALCHSPQYELDNKDHLAQDWARIPFPRSYVTFERIAELGRKLEQLLDPSNSVTDLVTAILGDSSSVGRIEAKNGGPVKARDLSVTYSFYGAAKGRWIRRPFNIDELAHHSWGEDTGDLFINPNICLRNVPDRVWTYEIGGYPLLKKWLGYRDNGRRPGSLLSLVEIEYLRSMVQRVSAIQIMHSDLDAGYELCLQDVIPREEMNGVAPV